MPEATDGQKKSDNKLSMDEIMAGLSDMAKNGDGAQRAAAYRLLLSAHASSNIYTEPLTPEDVVERIIRLMKLIGVGLTQMCYRKAFRNAMKADRISPALAGEEVELPPNFKYPRNVKQLYRLFPEIKGPGVPRGYPIGQGPIIQRAWLKELTDRTLKYKQQLQLDPQAPSQLDVKLMMKAVGIAEQNSTGNRHNRNLDAIKPPDVLDELGAAMDREAES